MGGGRAKLAAGLAAIVAIVAAAAVAVAFLLSGDDTPDPTPTAQAYLAAWNEGDFDAMAELVADPPDSLADAYEAVGEALDVSDAAYELTEVVSDGDRARADFDASLMLDGLGEWSYEGRVRLERTGEDGAWEVAWTPAAIHPRMRDDVRIARTRQRPERASITDASGEPLVSERPAVAIGLEPQRVENLQAVKDALAEHLDVDPATVDSRLGAPGVEPDHFVEIATLAPARFDAVWDAIRPVPGILFLETSRRQGPTEGFAQHVLGHTAEITAERLDELGQPYQVGDHVGITGLEFRFEEQLAGTPSGEIQLRDADDEVVDVIGVIPGRDPVPLATTLDAPIQTAVDAALADVDTPAAAVMVDMDGNVRAAASRPLDDGFNRALGGGYPPGSTFKVITTDALLGQGVTSTTPIDCPETVIAGGRQFRNFEGSSLGSIPFATAFAESCNTAFINAVDDLSADDLMAAAERFGFNTDYTVGLTTIGGQFPEPADDTEKAAAAIGQGRVLASPLHMATVAAAVIDGAWETPTLLPAQQQPDAEGAGPDDDPDANQGTDDASDDSEANGGADRSRTLDAEVRGSLADLMRRVVSEGSGTAAAVPGADIAGKTGTAEFGSGDPPPTHAWFIGFRGDHALAVVLEGGGVGGQDAAPLARQIFAALPD